MNPEAQAPQGPTEADIALGHSVITVAIRPTPEELALPGARPELKARPLKVRIVPVREMKAFALAFGREEVEAEFYLALLPKAEATALLGQLTEESFSALIEEGRRLNFRNFAAFHARQKQALAALNPQSEKREGSMVREALAAMLENPDGRELLKQTLGGADPEALLGNPPV